MRRRVLAWAVCLLGAPPLAAQVASLPDEDEPRFFALPLTRDAHTLAQRVEEHLAAGRMEEALQALQELLEEHADEVLPPAWSSSSARAASATAVHVGAAAWARARLFGLAPADQARYRARYEPAASQALLPLLEQADRARLLELAHRWPLTRAAASALIAVGDLELERGEALDALQAWQRAAEWARTQGQALDLAARRSAAERLSQVPGEPASTPRAAPSAWPAPATVELDPFASVQAGSMVFNIVPCLAGDVVLANTTLRVLAIDAFSGVRRWSFGPPSGWESLSPRSASELFEGLNTNELLVRPAVADGIVVAALQVPCSRDKPQSWQNIPIKNSIPERRLYAFDVATGERLWDHAPPRGWKGEGGTLAQRLSVAGSPVVAGRRVLSPCYSMEGRIEYRLSCHDLSTGALSWSTALISGQRELNMFGRVQKEFATAPACVAGDRVVVQTDLGALACVDLYTGEILWESLYPQIPLPPTRTYDATERVPVWARVAPPVVAGDGVVVAAPLDSADLVAFDLNDGRLLWSHRQDRELRALDVATRALSFDTLLGAQGDTVFLAGAKVSALQKPAGLRSTQRFVPRWTWTGGDALRGPNRPRPLLTQDALVIPLVDRRVVLDRRTGQERALEGGAWTNDCLGSLAAGPGALYSLSRKGLHAFLDWETLITRARAALGNVQAPPDGVGEAASLFVQRAEDLHESGSSSAALALLGEARAALDRARVRSGANNEVLRHGLFELLLVEARWQAELADLERALAALDLARSLAGSAHELARVLSSEIAYSRTRDPARTLRALADLGARCADLPLPAEALAGDVAWLVGESLIDPATLAALEPSRCTIGLWVCLARADLHARARRPQAALEDLHAALERYGELELVPGLDVECLVFERIARRIELDGRAAYAPFEARAETELAAAFAAHDSHALASLAHRFPHSAAGERARALRLDWAVASQDVTTVARIAHESLARSAASSEATALVLLRLAVVLERHGNRAYARAVLARCARLHPELVSDLPEHGGATLAELARERAPDAQPLAPPASFDARATRATLLQENHVPMGRALLSSAEDEGSVVSLQLYLRGSTLCAFASTRPAELFWSRALPCAPNARGAVAVAGARLAVACGSDLLAIDLGDGSVAWRTSLDGATAELCAVQDGLLLVLAGERRGARAQVQVSELFAFDLQAGVPLWRLALPGHERSEWWSAPLFVDGLALIGTARWATPSVLTLVDLDRGVLLEERELAGVDRDALGAAWVENGLYFLPRFVGNRETKSGLTAYDVETGAERWSLDFPAGEALIAVAGAEGKSYLVTKPDAVGPLTRSGGVYLIESALGGMRPVAQLRADDQCLGVRDKARTLLAAPYLFVLSPSGARATAVRAIHLPFDARWTYQLAVPFEELSRLAATSQPAVAEDCIAFLFARQEPAARQKSSLLLEIVERNSGLRLDGRKLPSEMWGADSLEISAAGTALYLCALRARRPLEGALEILEKTR
jgi:outer membrane protein assembly factor BamB